MKLEHRYSISFPEALSDLFIRYAEMDWFLSRVPAEDMDGLPHIEGMPSMYAVKGRRAYLHPIPDKRYDYKSIDRAT